MASLTAQVLVKSGVQSPSMARSDGSDVVPRALRDGTLLKFDWVEALAMEGRVFCAHFGTLDTPVALQTSFTATLPSLAVQVPDSIIAIPLYYEIQAAATGGAIFRTHLAITPTKVLAASAFAGTKITPLNVRLGSARSSACEAAHTVTTTGGDYTTGAIYLTHRGNQGDIDAVAIDGNYRWNVKDAGILPIVEDGGSICAFFYNTTSGTGWAKLYWAELDKEDFRLRE